MVPYARAMSHGLSDEGGNCGMAAMREPRARPSKVWWKEMARRRTRKDVPVATDRAMPMKTEWKRMPASRRRHWRRSFCCDWCVASFMIWVVGLGERECSRSMGVVSESDSWSLSCSLLTEGLYGSPLWGRAGLRGIRFSVELSIIPRGRSTGLKYRADVFRVLGGRAWPLALYLRKFTSCSVGTVSYSLPCIWPAPLVAKNISMPTTTSTEVMAMRPAIAGYP